MWIKLWKWSILVFVNCGNGDLNINYITSGKRANLILFVIVGYVEKLDQRYKTYSIKRFFSRDEILDLYSKYNSHKCSIKHYSEILFNIEKATLNFFNLLKLSRCKKNINRRSACLIFFFLLSNALWKRDIHESSIYTSNKIAWLYLNAYPPSIFSLSWSANGLNKCIADINIVIRVISFDLSMFSYL